MAGTAVRLDDETHSETHSDITQKADVPLVNSSLVTDRDSERITIYGQYKG